MQIEGEPLKIQKAPRWNAEQSCYTVPLAVADIPIMKLGQQIVEIHKQKYLTGYRFNSYTPPSLPPVHIAGYFGLSSWINVA
jgi:hypothetical protein